MSVPEPSASDRRLLLAIAVAAIVGVTCVVGGLWGIAHSGPEDPYWLTTMSVGGVIGGLIFIGIALAELIRRIRRGPQQPGRHTH